MITCFSMYAHVHTHTHTYTHTVNLTRGQEKSDMRPYDDDDEISNINLSQNQSH